MRVTTAIKINFAVKFVSTIAPELDALSMPVISMTNHGSHVSKHLPTIDAIHLIFLLNVNFHVSVEIFLRVVSTSAIVANNEAIWIDFWKSL
jgi:hypothetical protein